MPHDGRRRGHHERRRRAGPARGPAAGVLGGRRGASWPPRLFGVDGPTSPLVSERDQNVTVTTGDGTWFRAEDQQSRRTTRASSTCRRWRCCTSPLRPDAPGDATGAERRRRRSIAGRGRPGRSLLHRPHGHVAAGTHHGAGRPSSRDASHAFGVARGATGASAPRLLPPVGRHPLAVEHQARARSATAGRTTSRTPRRRAIVERGPRPFRGARASGVRRSARPGDPQRPDAGQRLFDDEQRVSGVIDFGDMAHSALICDFDLERRAADGRASRSLRVAGGDGRRVTPRSHRSWTTRSRSCPTCC